MTRCGTPARAAAPTTLRPARKVSRHWAATLSGSSLQRAPFELAAVVVVEVVEDAGLADEESPVDEVGLEVRLLDEPLDPRAVEVEQPEPGGRVDGGDGEQLPLGAVEVHQVVEVHVA